MRPLTARAILGITVAALLLAAWLRDPIVTAAAGLLVLGGFHAAMKRATHPTPLKLAVDCACLGVLAWITALVIAVLCVVNAIDRGIEHDPTSMPGLLVVAAVFALLRMGRPDRRWTDGALMLSACVPVLVPPSWSTVLRLALCAASALYLAWHGWVLLGPVPAGLLRGGGR